MKKSRKKNITWHDNLKQIPLYLILALIPFIVKEHYYNTHLEHIAWFASNRELDLFLYWKSIAIIVTGAVMILILWFKNRKEKQKFPLIFIPLIVFELFVVLSSVLSPNTYYSFHGITQQFESIWVLLTYGVITYYGYEIIRTEEELQKVMKWLCIGVFGIIIIGLSQLMGVDFYKFLFQNKGYNFVFEPGRVYAAFYNPNYVGSYVSLLFPVFLSLFIAKKDIKNRVLLGTVIIGLLLILIGSKSTTGFILTSFITLIFLLFYRKWIQHRKAVITVLLLFCGILYLFRGFISENVIGKIIDSFHGKVKTEQKLERIETNDNNIKIEYMGNSFYMEFMIENEENGEYTFQITDEKNQGLDSNIDYNTGTITLMDERFSGISINVIYITELSELLAFSVEIDGKIWNFTNQTDGSYYIITNAGKLDKIKEYSSALFTDIPSFASGRGYIWAKTIPLLKNTLILGTGADTFMLAYPNDDYVENYKNGMEYVYVTKPHNMYLQMGVQTGMISVIAFLCFYFIYAFDSLKIFWKNEYKTYESKMGLGIFLGTFAYMIVGMINDSTVTISPVFWCLMGMGIGINRRIGRIDRIS